MKDIYETFKSTTNKIARAETIDDIMKEYRDYRTYLRFMNIRGKRFSMEVHRYLCRKIEIVRDYYLKLL